MYMYICICICAYTHILSPLDHTRLFIYGQYYNGFTYTPIRTVVKRRKKGEKDATERSIKKHKADRQANEREDAPQPPPRPGYSSASHPSPHVRHHMSKGRRRVGVTYLRGAKESKPWRAVRGLGGDVKLYGVPCNAEDFAVAAESIDRALIQRVGAVEARRMGLNYDLGADYGPAVNAEFEKLLEGGIFMPSTWLFSLSISLLQSI